MPVPVSYAHMDTPKRGDPMKRKAPGKVVETMLIGGATIQIRDDFFAETPEEIEQVLDDHHAAGWKIHESLERKNAETDEPFT